MTQAKPAPAAPRSAPGAVASATGANSPTLDQLRLFVAVADEGSFSAAGRRLHRAQSAVSYGIGKLEDLLDVKLFERTGHRPQLTGPGQTLLSAAIKVLAQVGQLQTRAMQISGQLESDLSVVVDAIFPADLLVELCRGFQQRFPSVPLHIHTEVLQGVTRLVLDGSCHIGISGPFGSDSDRLQRRYLTHLAMTSVASASHPLASQAGPIPTTTLRDHTQIVISERLAPDNSTDHGVLSELTWRVADAGTKLSLIRAGLGWGNLPAGMVQADLMAGSLKHLQLEDTGPAPFVASLYTVTRRDLQLGPAGQGLIAYAHELCGRGGI